MLLLHVKGSAPCEAQTRRFFFVVLDDSFWLLVTWICYGSHSLANMFLAEQKRIRVHKSKAHVGSCRNIVVNMKVWKYAENLLDSLICRQIHSSIQMACKWATQSEQDWLFLFIVQYIIATYILYGRGNHERDVVFAGHVHAYERSVSVYSLGK